MTLKNTWRDIALILLALLVIVLLFTKSCGGKKGEYADLVEAEKALREKSARDSAFNAQQRAIFQNRIDSAWKERGAVMVEKRASDRKLAASQQRVLQLLAQLRDESGRPVDSSFVLVSPGYKQGCDTLQVVVLRQQGEITEAQQLADETIELMNYEIELRDSALRGEVRYSDSLRADFNRQSMLMQTALKTLKPRGKLMAGAGLLGNANTWVQGGEILIAYQTKGGTQFQAAAVLVGNTVYYKGSILKQLFK